MTHIYINNNMRLYLNPSEFPILLSLAKLFKHNARRTETWNARSIYYDWHLPDAKIKHTEHWTLRLLSDTLQIVFDGTWCLYIWRHFDIHELNAHYYEKLFETTDHPSHILNIVSRLAFMRLTQFRTNVIESHNFVNRLLIASIEPHLLHAFVSLLWMDIEIIADDFECQSFSGLVLLSINKMLSKTHENHHLPKFNFWNQSIIDRNENCDHLIRA